MEKNLPNLTTGIRSVIYEVRGQKVMLDRDLAALYQVETKVLNQAVKRNIERFPEDFMFQLTVDEVVEVNTQKISSMCLRSQDVTSNASPIKCESVDSDTGDSLRSQIVTSNERGGTRYRPYAFTEQGLAMLSGVLKSKVAIQVNINIMRAFVAMRHQLLESLRSDKRIEAIERRMNEMQRYQEDVLRDQNDTNEDLQAQLDALSESLAMLQADSVQNRSRVIVQGYNSNSKQ